VLAGKYNAEVPRLAADNRTMKATVDDLTGKVTTLTTQIEDLRSKEPVAPLISPEEVTEFGEPLVDMTRRAATEVATKVAAPLQRDLAEFRTEITDLKRDAADRAWRNCIDTLTTMVPDWAQINVNADFLSWLDGTDDLSGHTRQELLDRAKDARDAARLARFFTSWKEANQDKATTARNAMEPHVVPDSSSRTVVPAGKRVFSRREISQFYADVRAGRVGDAEAIVIEAEINAAMNEGRIR
jgi:hypothetical protein